MRKVNTIREQVYEIIKNNITSGVYPSGKWLQEMEIANELNVSRSPVREALRQLGADGLVVEVPNKGVYVREFTKELMEDILEARLAIENYAIIRISSQLTADEKKTLEMFAEQFEAFISDTIVNDMLFDDRSNKQKC